MAPAYRNVSSGQVVVSGEARPDLEALARWESVDASEAEISPATVETTEGAEPETGDGNPENDDHDAKPDDKGTGPEGGEPDRTVDAPDIRDTIDVIQAFAKEYDIDVSGASKKAEMIDIIDAALNGGDGE